MTNLNAHKPGYKHTPLGWVPEEWEVKKLDEVAQIQQGVSKGKSIREEDAIDMPYLRVANVKDGYFDLNEIKQITVHKIEYNKYLLNQEDILITEGGDPDKLGRGSIWQNEVENCIFQNHLFRIRAIKSNLNPYYLYNYLQGRKSKDYFLSCAKQTTGIASVNSSQVKAMPVLLPLLPEQNKIATILSTWDTAIAKTQEIISQLKLRNRGLMHELLRPNDGWEEYKIGELIKEVKRPVNWDDNDLYHLISVKRRSGGAFFRESLYGHQILTKQLFTVEENDFLISKMQILHGASALVTAPLAEMKISGSYIAVRSRDDQKLDIRYFNWIAKTPWFYRLTYISSYGVHIEKMTFDFEDFKRHKILLPATLKEQKDIVVILENATTEVALYENYLTTLQTQKKGLMQKLLTGTIRVNII